MSRISINHTSDLEMTMHEVMHGMDDLVSGLVWQISGDTFEIIEIKPPATSHDCCDAA
ncbi:MAG: hypothetical protein WCX90_08075 [Thiohalomonadaceae bacterium]